MTTPALRDQTLHQLRSQQRMQSWLRYGIALAVILGAVAAGLLFVWLRPVPRYWPLAVVGVLLALVYQASNKLVRRMLERFDRAIALVQSSTPQTVHLSPTLLLAFEGRLLCDEQHRRVFGFQVPKYSRFGARPEQPVWVWLHPGTHEAVGNDNGNVALGTCLDRAGFDQAMRRLGRIWWVLGAATWALIGFFVGMIHLVDVPDLRLNLERAVAAQTWPRVAAVVEAASVREVRVSRGKATVSAWVPDIRYRYTVQGQTYHGQIRRFFEEPLASPVLLDAVVAHYPVGAAIDIAVSPDDAALAVIEPGHEEPLRQKMQNFYYLTLVLLLLGLLLCVVFAFLARWQRRMAQQIRLQVMVLPPLSGSGAGH